jgi:Tol biopolymer transport system component
MKFQNKIGLFLFLMVSLGCARRSTLPQLCQIAYEREGINPNDEFINSNIEIYVMDCDGSNQVQLTDQPSFDLEPDWSPDGKQIVYVSYQDGNFEIYIMNADGSEKRNFSDHPSADYYPAWSPDGKWIAYHSNRDGDREIYLQSVNSEEVIKITDNQYADQTPTWSPKGDKLAFAQAQDENFMSTGLAIVSLDDLTVELVIPPDILNIREPTWSPDGRWIAFTARIENDDEIFVVNTRNWKYTQITYDFNNNLRAVNGSSSWSPDSSQIVFHSHREGRKPEIYIMNRDGTEVRKIPNTGWEDWGSYNPDWRP